MLTLLVGRTRSVTGTVTPRNSDLARDTGDLTFRACGERCARLPFHRIAAEQSAPDIAFIRCSQQSIPSSLVP